MESSYADQEDGGIMDDNYIPNLTKLAKENINFSDKADGKLGGPTCLEATAYTVGGMVAHMFHNECHSLFIAVGYRNIAYCFSFLLQNG